MAVTVVETPPIKIAAVRAYQRTAYGLQCVGEIWAEKLDPELARSIPLVKNLKEKNWTSPKMLMKYV